MINPKSNPRYLTIPVATRRSPPFVPLKFANFSVWDFLFDNRYFILVKCYRTCMCFNTHMKQKLLTYIKSSRNASQPSDGLMPPVAMVTRLEPRQHKEVLLLHPELEVADVVAQHVVPKVHLAGRCGVAVHTGREDRICCTAVWCGTNIHVPTYKENVKQ